MGEKSSLDILPNISFCVTHEKQNDMGLEHVNDDNLQFEVKRAFKEWTGGLKNSFLILNGKG